MDLTAIISSKSVFYGFLVWLIPFLIGFFTFPIKNKQPLVFKTIMAVVLVAVSAIFSKVYLTSIPVIDPSQGAILGCFWAMICIAIDIPVFIYGFKTKATCYFLEIGLAYLIIPIITWSNSAMRVIT